MIDFASMNKTVYKFCFATLACNWKTKTNLWRKKERKKGSFNNPVQGHGN